MALKDKGTPKTLTEAIENGIEAYEEDRSGETQAQCVQHIRNHVADFIRNGIGPTHLLNNDETVAQEIKVFLARLK